MPQDEGKAWLTVMDGFMPGEECRQCRGRCCRERGCSLSPEDLHRAFARETGSEKHWSEEEGLCQAVLFLLQKETGNELYAIDYFNMAGAPVFYLRMRHKCHTFIGVDAIGECVALAEDGCTLDAERRPRGGRYLKSSPDGHCVQNYTREMMAKDWEPYQKILSLIWKEYEARFRQDGTFDRCEEAYFEWMRRQRRQSKETEYFES